MSVDYLIGTAAATTAPQLLEHRVFTHGSDEQFLAAAIPFLADGIERSHCLLAVTTAAQTGLLRDALDDRSEHVEFADSADWYRSPKAALNGYRAFVKEKFEAGAAWIRIVGEADWGGIVRCRDHRVDPLRIDESIWRSRHRRSRSSVPTT